ncbi:hypothetical protein [Arundinibacter roseus]|uniref:Uncharacterized protein n=1 Tax=Arundinibacter roseus TaxID=2070510 RepID=A0A4R4KQ93_9BACT|nr:hypothetical protein [Arundinibacter roseus]TDB69082.1 hypothetical protein EZE20_01740 [Arundinibacter roseus]
MLPRIENGEAFSRFLTLYRQHNANCPTYTLTRTRKTADGRIYHQEIMRKSGTITESVKTTFYMVLRQYVDSYNRIASTMPAGMYTQEDPPSMLTNCVRMGELCDCSDRTVRNHLNRLRSLGVVRTKFHGSKHDFELWISKEILFGGEGEEAAKPLKKVPNSPLPEGFSKIFPHSNTHREFIEKENGNADFVNCGYGENDYRERGRAETGDSLNEMLPNEPTGQEQRKMIGGAGGAKIAKPAIPQVRLPQLPKQYLELLMEFWLYAWRVIYPGRDFSRDEQEKALLAIAAGVYRQFSEERTPREWVDFQTRQLEKLDKAAKYYDNHPEAYRPDPFAVHVPGRGYFDAENLQGFTGLEAWMKRDEVKGAHRKQAYAETREKVQKRAEALLRTARRDFEKLRLEVKPRKEVAHMNQISLFQYYRTSFEGLGKTWTDKFCKQYLDQQAADFQPPKYYKSRKTRRQAGEMTPEVIIEVESWMQEGEGWYSEI